MPQSATYAELRPAYEGRRELNYLMEVIECGDSWVPRAR
jgi:hypothetical protein